ncbi:MAG: hypothetical protein HOO06_13370 [Bdellovibrionaceae bacterium]|nr:hypothetical protein [Pseudobdellovibrionaceae bacterium]
MKFFLFFILYSFLVSGCRLDDNQIKGDGISSSGPTNPDDPNNPVISGPNQLKFIYTASDKVNFSPLDDLVIHILDSSNNLNINSNVAVTLTISTNPSARTAAFVNNGSTSITLNAVSGVADFSHVMIDEFGTGFVITASTPGLNNVSTNVFNITGKSKIYRSFGVGSTTAIEDSDTNARSLSITGKKATFSLAVAGNIGVGDIIQYDSDGGGDGSATNAIDSFVIIQRRLSSTEFLIHKPDYSQPTETLSDMDFSICRASISLNDAEDLIENEACIDDALGAPLDFDADVGGRDITTNNEQWNIAFYADAIETAALIAETGWTLSAESYIRFFTPNKLSEVGISQRHDGKWNNSKARMEVMHYYAGFSIPTFKYLRIEGFQIQNNYNSSAVAPGSGITFGTGAVGSGEIYFTDNVITKTAYTGDITESYGIAIWSGSNDKKIIIANNVISGFKEGISKRNTTDNLNLIVYNNTVGNFFSIAYRIGRYGSNDKYNIKNNVVENNNSLGLDWFLDDTAGVSDLYENNHSTDSTAPGNSTQTGHISFMGSTSIDYRLAASDNLANNTGLDLTSDPDYVISEDIKEAPITTTFHLGAHAYKEYNGSTMTTWSQYGSGTAEDPYGIFNKAQLKDLGNNGCGNGNATACDKEFSIFEDIDLNNEAYNPIGDSGDLFSGTINGNGHIIQQITIPAGNDGGLIGKSCNAVIDNLTLTNFSHSSGSTGIGALVGSAACSLTVDNVKVTSSSFTSTTGGRIGGLIGYFSGTNITVSNSMTDATVTCKNYCGGLMGILEASAVSSIDNTYTKGNTIHTTSSPESDLGGFIGVVNSLGVSINISNSYTTGTVTGSGPNVGGFIGAHKANGIIINSYSTGLVSNDTSDHTGGFIGLVSGASTISDSYSLSDVRSTGSYIGGFIGAGDSSNIGTSVSNSWALGDVKGFMRAGGFIGTNSGVSISYSHAHGNVQSDEQTGGFVGNNISTSGTLSWSYATGEVKSNASVRTGGFVGLSEKGITDSYATGNVYGGNTTGGFSGQGHGDTTRSFATGNVYGADNTGGFVGAQSGATYGNIFATGNVYGANNVGGVAGITGFANRSYSTGAVFGNTNVGGFIGRATLDNLVQSYTRSKAYARTPPAYAFVANPSGTTVNWMNNYWDSEIESSDGTNLLASDAGKYESRTTTQLKSKLSPLNGFDMTNDWTMVDGSSFPIHRWDIRAQCILNANASTYNAIGNGVLGDPYILCNKQQLSHLTTDGCGIGASVDCNKVFYLGADIDLKNSAPTQQIGVYPNNCFSGIFDGHLGSIISYSYTAGSDDKGLFNCNSGTIRNLKMKNIFMQADDQVSGLVVYSDNGKIINSHVDGVIDAGGYHIGGLVARSYNRSLILYSSFSGTLNGNSRIGGILGRGDGHEIIMNSNSYIKDMEINSSAAGILGATLSPASDGGIYKTFSLGAITDTGSGYAVAGISTGGGKVYESFSGLDITLSATASYASGLGASDADFFDSYSIQNVLSSGYSVSGLINGGSTTRSYAVSTSLLQTGSGVPNEFCANCSTSNSADSYWNSSTFLGGAGDPGHITPLTTTEMQDDINKATNFLNWDFINTWFIGDGVRSPQLRWMYHSVCQDNPTATTFNAIGAGTSDNPYKICFKEQLTHLAANCGAVGTSCSQNYLLMNNVDLNNDVAMTPIGDAINPFTGTFDGQNHSIYRLYLNNPTTGDQGLFGVTQGVDSYISNLNLVDVNITGQGNVGSLVGRGRSTQFNNITASGKVIGNGDGVGGLIGTATRYNISDSTEIKNSNVSVTVETVGTFEFTGGFIGSAGGSDYTLIINNCHATGSVTGRRNVGGFIGGFHGTKIINSSSSGTVSASYENAGGFIGRTEISTAVITRSYSRSNVTGTSKVGGFIGTIRFGTISNSFATGSATATSGTAGGFVGNVEFDNTTIIFTNNYSSGIPVGSTKHGFVGYRLNGAANSALMTNNYWDETASTEPEGTSPETSGKFEHLTAAEMMIDTNFSTWNFTTLNQEIWAMIPGEAGPSLRK